MNRIDESGAVYEFLALVENAEPGWSAQLGGPEGVARRCHQLYDEMRGIQARISDIRAAAVEETLQTQSGVEAASALGMSQSAFSGSS